MSDQARVLGDDDLISVPDLPTIVPSWPFSPALTHRWIREEKLGTVAVGRRRFVTVRLLREFVEQRTRRFAAVQQKASGTP